MNHKQRLRDEFIIALREEGISLTEAKTVGYRDERVLRAIGFCLCKYPVSFHRDDITDIMCETLWTKMEAKAKELYFRTRKKQAA